MTAPAARAVLFDKLCGLLNGAGIDLKGLFWNAHLGYDPADFVTDCQQEEYSLLIQ